MAASSSSRASREGRFFQCCCHWRVHMDASNLQVWVVDDDASIRWVLERALRNAQMQPTSFDAAEPAIAALRARSPNVLMTDVRMGGKSGLDLLRSANEL